jgi:hypothetical protein
MPKLYSQAKRNTTIGRHCVRSSRLCMNGLPRTLRLNLERADCLLSKVHLAHPMFDCASLASVAPT